MFLLTVKWFQAFLSKMNDSIDFKGLVCPELNCFLYCDVILEIQINISHLFALS